MQLEAYYHYVYGSTRQHPLAASRETAESMSSMLSYTNTSGFQETRLPKLRGAHAGASCVSEPMAGQKLTGSGVTQMKGYPDRIGACTTTYFDGIIAVIDPETSWVARWQRTCKSLPCLASHVLLIRSSS